MTDLPLVSVVAVCYNHAKYVIETLDSIKNQTYSNIELIIMDDCSTDDSVEVIEDWIANNNYDCKFIAHEENKGICVTLNEALSVIKGVYYQGVACDDILLSHKLENQVNEFSELGEGYAVVYSDAYLIDGNSELCYGNFIQRYKPQILEVPKGEVYEELILSNYIPAMSVLIKTELVKEIGGYDENLSYEDYDLWLRLAKSYKFYFSEYKSCKYRIHSNNMHTSREFNERSLVNSFRIFIKHKENNIAFNKLQNYTFQLYKEDLHTNFVDEILKLNLKENYIVSIKKGLGFSDHMKLMKKVKLLARIKRKLKIN